VKSLASISSPMSTLTPTSSLTLALILTLTNLTPARDLRHPSLTGQDIVALSFGVNHGACVHRNGSLQMWGSGFYQGFVLGQGGKTMASDVPVDIELPMSATDVSCGDTFVLAAAVGGGNLCDITVPALPLRVTCCADSLGAGVRAVGWAWETTTTGGSRSRCGMCVRALHSLADALDAQIQSVIGSRVKHVAAGRSHACAWA
jgi:hypothetical protein